MKEGPSWDGFSTVFHDRKLTFKELLTTSKAGGEVGVLVNVIQRCPLLDPTKLTFGERKLAEYVKRLESSR